jgi:hypothetical protein
MRDEFGRQRLQNRRHVGEMTDADRQDDLSGREGGAGFQAKMESPAPSVAERPARMP